MESIGNSNISAGTQAPKGAESVPRGARGPDFDGAPLARMLIRTGRSASLATMEEDGTPFASLVATATDVDGAPLVLVSSLARHTRHLDAHRRASLLFSRPGKGDPLAHPRVTVAVEAARIARGCPEAARIRLRFLARHPKSELYVDFPDFAFFRLAPQRVSVNGGFARAWDGEGASVTTALAGREAFRDDAQAIHARLAALPAETLDRLAMRAGAAGGGWRAIGLDPEGVDLAAGDMVARLEFASAAQTVEAAFSALAPL